MSELTDWLWTMSDSRKDNLAQAAKRIEELEASMFAAYCAGYEMGHAMANENIYSPPEEWAEDWPEIQIKILEHELLVAKTSANALMKY